MEEGFLRLDAAAGLYRVGPAWAAALYMMGGNSILSEILDHDLQALAETTGEAVYLSIRKGDQIQVISVVSTSSGFTPTLPPGPFVLLSEHAMVHARIHLAYADEATRGRMAAVPAVRHTEHTVTDPAEIEARLAREASEGVARSREGYKRGASGLAVPIFSQGEVVAALGLVVPTERFDAKVDEYTQSCAPRRPRWAAGWTRASNRPQPRLPRSRPPRRTGLHDLFRGFRRHSGRIGRPRAPPTDYSRSRVGIQMMLEYSPRPLRNLPPLRRWHDRLVDRVTGWPRTRATDPYKAAVDDLAAGIAERLGMSGPSPDTTSSARPRSAKPWSGRSAPVPLGVLVVPTMLLPGQQPHRDRDPSRGRERSAGGTPH